MYKNQLHVYTHDMSNNELAEKNNKECNTT